MTLAATLAEAKRADAPNILAAAIPYFRFLGLRVEAGDSGLLVVLPADRKLVGNPVLPALHGGVTGALMEAAAILELLWQRPDALLPKTINLKVDYLRPAGLKDTFARAHVTKQGRRIAHVRIDAWQDQPDRPVAAAHAHFLLA